LILERELKQSFEVRDSRDGFLWINNEVVDDLAPKIGASAFLVYAVIARHASKLSTAFPSQATIAEKCGLSERAIRTALSVLRDSKLLTWEQVKGPQKKHPHNVYTLLKPPANFAATSENPRQKTTETTGSQLPANKIKPNKKETPITPDGVQEIDPRHSMVRTFIQTCYEKLCGIKAPWAGPEAKMLSQLLKDNPSWTYDQIRRMVWNRFRSENHPRSEAPRRWLNNVSAYIDGPLDRFGKVTKHPEPIAVLVNTNAVNDAEVERKRREAKLAK
jgi:hypothetical protein